MRIQGEVSSLQSRRGLSAQFSSLQSLSHIQLFVTSWTAAHQASLSITNSRNPPKLMSFESVTPSNHLILCRPLSSCSQSFPASGSFPMSQFSATGGQSIGASASVLPMNNSGLISFRMDWLDLPAVQGTLKSLHQHHSSKAPVLRHSPKSNHVGTLISHSSPPELQ